MSELLGRKLFDKTILYLQRSLGLRSLNHRVISNNITNVYTPGYIPKELPFQRLLDQAIEKANSVFIAKTNVHHYLIILKRITSWNQWRKNYHFSLLMKKHR